MLRARATDRLADAAYSSYVALVPTYHGSYSINATFFSEAFLVGGECER